jgi:oligoribonuclease
MYRGSTRIGDVISPFKRETTLQRAIEAARQQITQTPFDDPMENDKYFRMATEMPYTSTKNSARAIAPSGDRVNLTGYDNIAWIDMEMSGLDPYRNHILEISMVVTDGDLNLVAEHETETISHNEQVIESFNEWCKKQHGESGLTDRVRQSTRSIKDVENDLVQFTQRFCAPNGRTCLAGNTVYMDKNFLHQHMPLLDNMFHYRVIDVSSISELCKRWRVDLYKSKPHKLNTHRARIDIYESIRELMYYRRFLFNLKK